MQTGSTDRIADLEAQNLLDQVAVGQALAGRERRGAEASVRQYGETLLQRPRFMLSRRSQELLRSHSLALALICFGWPVLTQAQTTGTSVVAARDGQRDFDFEIGTWTTRVRVARNPLSNQPLDWVEYVGTSVVRPLMGGRANFVELAVEGGAGAIEGGSLRLYNPRSEQWSLNFASLRDGMLTAPVYGRFDDRGRGLFYGQDLLEGRAIQVRFAIDQVSRKEIHFEQAYSADGGVTWEVNWVAVDTRR